MVETIKSFKTVQMCAFSVSNNKFEESPPPCCAVAACSRGQTGQYFLCW